MRVRALSVVSQPSLLPGPPPRLTVRQGRERSLQARHPWLRRDALKSGPRNIPPGAIVDLYSASGRFLARGSYNDSAPIAVRVLSFCETETVDETFIRRRIADSVARRAPLAESGETDAYRLVFAEADGLPGLIVDRYADWLVVQILTAGMEVWRESIVTALAELLSPRGIYERSDGQERQRREGVAERCGLLWGEEPPAWIPIREHGLPFVVDVRRGHKTGCYLDQRQSRAAVARYAGGAQVLNVFAYNGSFGVYAVAADAEHVVHIDSSPTALAMAKANLALAAHGERHELLCADAFDTLRELHAAGRRFDLVILDPPKFAATKEQLDRALRGYKEINLTALRLLEPGGYLATFSCSGAVDALTFRRMLAGAALDAGREVQMVETLGQPVDHPVLLSFPESEYLRGLVLRVVG